MKKYFIIAFLMAQGFAENDNVGKTIENDAIDDAIHMIDNPNSYEDG